MESVRILLAIHHEILRDGITMILKENPDFSIANSVQTREDLLKTIIDDGYDILILDLDIPNLDSTSVIKKVKKENPDVNILPISGPREANEVKKVLQTDAAGFMFKRRGKDELLKALELINSGNQYLCRDTINILLDESDTNQTETGELTEREVEILELICNEHTNKEIANLLNISTRTVDAHRRNLLQKTGAKNTAGLVKYAVKHKIFTPK